jgi:hypothetical protein
MIILYRTRADDHIAQQNLLAVLRSSGNSTADTCHQAQVDALEVRTETGRHDDRMALAHALA